ncbi:MAG: hypothetical protein II699_00420, partial [Lachnospiraceae bacterium]|nr:hypothetical protein [Lachnospiraceae bacterium]
TQAILCKSKRKSKKRPSLSITPNNICHNTYLPIIINAKYPKGTDPIGYLRLKYPMGSVPSEYLAFFN